MAYGDPKDPVIENNPGTGASAPIPIPGRPGTPEKLPCNSGGAADGESKERKGINKRSHDEMEESLESEDLQFDMSQEWNHPKGDDVSSKTENRPVKRANLQSSFRNVNDLAQYNKIAALSISL